VSEMPIVQHRVTTPDGRVIETVVPGRFRRLMRYDLRNGRVRRVRVHAVQIAEMLECHYPRVMVLQRFVCEPAVLGALDWLVPVP